MKSPKFRYTFITFSICRVSYPNIPTSSPIVLILEIAAFLIWSDYDVTMKYYWSDPPFLPCLKEIYLFLVNLSVN